MDTTASDIFLDPGPGETSEAPEGFELDITLLELADPAVLVNMTDDGCGTTCAKTTCISAA
ncbi:FxLD family lanthipeptide [Streptomyces jumonjinensis]|uniref:FxLD family lantipeptide n=1 Tax=Streptomyces jumonjinensis TaxID=1945 RepID=A0A646KT92_STRJU|nr:FxLD family lanthipeptide [Streptomyces jumonjinensis]MQT05081.1 FxLD family lantipeptide [Streptomyces jumonjinensis]